jgi:hypothetical protein
MLYLHRIFHTGVAQSVEHRSPKPSVGRSSRSSRANKAVGQKPDGFLFGDLVI